jgi:teichuronic acid biosynthesis glycosyltransferase TuaC
MNGEVFLKDKQDLKVLFVSSGNSEKGISPIVKAQGESLRRFGVDVEYFTIVGKGVKGYLKNVLPLRAHIKKNNYDIVHAHYSLSALTATLAGYRPLVVSLMGSDIRLGLVIKYAVIISSRFFWSALIVKSQDMLNNIIIKNSAIIPNGVDAALFKPIEQSIALEKLGWDKNKKHILFAANPVREVKNFQLLEKAYEKMIWPDQTQLHVLEDISHQEIPVHMNASDVAVLTSLWEGSPNVVKEAMACNCPVVATDVGDIAWLFGEESGHYLTSFESEDVAAKLSKALDFAEKHGRTKGRERIVELGLDAESVAKRIIKVYESVLDNNA